MSEAHAEPSFWSKYVFSTDHKVIGIQFQHAFVVEDSLFGIAFMQQGSGFEVGDDGVVPLVPVRTQPADLLVGLSG